MLTFAERYVFAGYSISQGKWKESLWFACAKLRPKREHNQFWFYVSWLGDHRLMSLLVPCTQAEFDMINLASYTTTGTVVDIQVTRNGTRVVRWVSVYLLSLITSEGTVSDWLYGRRVSLQRKRGKVNLSKNARMVKWSPNGGAVLKMGLNSCCEHSYCRYKGLFSYGVLMCVLFYTKRVTALGNNVELRIVRILWIY